MAAMKSPSDAIPDLGLLRQVTKLILERHLTGVAGRKPFDLIIDSMLMRPLDRLVQGASFFKQNGAQRIIKLEEKMTGDIQRIYLIRPSVENVKRVVGHVTSAVARQSADPEALPIKMTILFVPRKSFICERVLEEEGVFGHVILEDCKIDLIPLDDDLLSLELPYFFRDVFLRSDLFWLHSVASSLVTLQKVLGSFVDFVSVGPVACDVKRLLRSLKEAEPAEEASISKVNRQIHTVILLDRSVDLVTPLLTQITYEGMLDETYGIGCGLIEFPEEVTRKKGLTKMLLTNDDLIYREVRNRHFTNVFGFLKVKAKQLQADFDSRHNLESVGEMKDFVATRLKALKASHKSLELHISACENIINKTTGYDGEIEDRLKAEHTIVDGGLDAETLRYIETHLALQTDSLKVLRLLCLCSVIADGLPNREYSSLKSQFLHAHGFEHIPPFHALARANLFKSVDVSPTSSSSKPASLLTSSLSSSVSSTLSSSFAKSSFSRISAKLKLLPRDREAVDLKNPTSVSYVFSGAYAPLSARLTEEIVTKGYDAVAKDTLDLCTSRHEASRSATSARSFSSARGGSAPNIAVTKRGSAVGSALDAAPTGSSVLVYFLGGVTFAEVAALRFLGKVRGLKFIIATTAFVNGDTFLESVIEED